MDEFHKVDRLLKNFVFKCPEFEGDAGLVRELGEAMGLLKAAIDDLREKSTYYPYPVVEVSREELEVLYPQPKDPDDSSRS